MKEEKHNYLIETDASAADQHGEMHDSFKHMRQRKIGEIAIGRHGANTRVQATTHCRNQIAMRHKNSLRKTGGSAGVADGADVVRVGRMVDHTVLVTNVHNLLHGVHGDALEIRKENRGYVLLRDVASLLVDVAHVDDDLQRGRFVEKHHQLRMKRCDRRHLHGLGRGTHACLHFCLLENELHRVCTQRIVDRTQGQAVGVAALLGKHPVDAVLSVDSDNLVLQLREED